ncbi:MAG: CAP domain-containing protein [Nitrosospira sp.]|nr:CAP domain-containing protein [Nitrosospira sp.]
MKTNCAFAIAALVSVLSPLFTVNAASGGELLELINAYRAGSPLCEGARREPLPPLTSDSTLAQIKGVGQLQEALRAAGYPAARAETMTLSGPSNVRAALRFAVQLNCRLLLSPGYSVAGVSRQGRDWQIVLAQPLLDPDLGDWREAGHQVLKLVNAARGKERNCGNKQYKAAPALSWNEKLGAAAHVHSRDMAEQNYFGHEAPSGSTVGTRARHQGYPWRSIGENVAAGKASPQQVIDGWLSSPGHCANIMNGNFTEMGAAYATNPESDMMIYWTQVFGSPR